MNTTQKIVIILLLGLGILVLVEYTGEYDFGFGVYPKPDPDDDDVPLPDDDDDVPLPLPGDDDDDDIPLPDDDVPIIPLPGGGYYDENGEWVLKEDTGCVKHSVYDGSSNNRIRAEWVENGKKKDYVFDVGAFRNTETSPFETAASVDFVFVNQPTLYLFSGRDFTGECAVYDYKTYKQVTMPNTQNPFKPKSLIVDNKNAIMQSKGCPALFSSGEFPCL